MNEKKLKVVYILGSGRSGSTVLDTVLGNHQEMESLGELSRLPRNGWINGEFCSCGTRVTECDFWKKVRAEWEKTTPDYSLEKYLAAQEGFLRFRYLPKLLFQHFFPSKEFQQFVAATENLYFSIAKTNGSSLLVDSSKSPAVALALCSAKRLDFRVLHLTRDARGVAYSQKASFEKDEKAGLERDLRPRSVLRTGFFWNITNLLSGFVRSRLPHASSVRIRYEDFMRDPRKTLEQIATCIGLPLEELAEKIEQGEEFSVGHNVAGNRLRMAGSVRLSPDTKWVKMLSSKDKALVWISTCLLMKRYDYTKTPH